MSRKTRRNPKAADATAVRQLPPASASTRKWLWLAVTCAGLLFGVAALVLYRASGPALPLSKPLPEAAGESVARPPAQYVGSTACEACHARESAAWKDSQHAHAMQPATPETVLGDFSGSRFAGFDGQTVFER